jgi:hypothetical protein
VLNLVGQEFLMVSKLEAKGNTASEQWPQAQSFHTVVDFQLQIVNVIAVVLHITILLSHGWEGAVWEHPVM